MINSSDTILMCMCVYLCVHMIKKKGVFICICVQYKM